MTRKDFIDTYGHVIEPLAKANKLFPEIVYAQAFIEGSDGKGNFGESYTMKYGNNVFNIRPGANWHGETISNPLVKSESKIFRKYDSIEEGIRNYFDFLNQNKRYKVGGVFDAKTIEEQAAALQRSGFAGSSTTYADLITKISSGVKKMMGKAASVEKAVVKNVSDNATYYVAGAGLILAAIAYEKKWIKF